MRLCCSVVYKDEINTSRLEKAAFTQQFLHSYSQKSASIKPESLIAATDRQVRNFRYYKFWKKVSSVVRTFR